MHYHMQNEQYRKVVEVCELYGDQEACLWEQALGYFAHKEEDCKEYVAAVLKHIETKNLMPPLLGEWNEGWFGNVSGMSEKEQAGTPLGARTGPLAFLLLDPAEKKGGSVSVCVVNF